MINRGALRRKIDVDSKLKSFGSFRQRTRSARESFAQL